MILIDVNVLIYAHKSDAVDSAQYRRWLEGVIAGDEAFGLSELALSAFLRIVTNPRIMKPPSTIADALQFIDDLRTPQSRLVRPGERHWEIFADLCRLPGVRGDVVSDAYFAALAIESGCEWITTDRDFTRFPGLRTRHPLGKK